MALFLGHVTECDRFQVIHRKIWNSFIMWIISQHIHLLSEVNPRSFGKSESQVAGGHSFSSCFIQLRLDWSGLWPWGVSGNGGVTADGWSAVETLGAERKSASRYLPPPPGRCVSSSSLLRSGSRSSGGRYRLQMVTLLFAFILSSRKRSDRPIRMFPTQSGCPVNQFISLRSFFCTHQYTSQ